MAESYEAVLFDFDGVLADSEPVHFACWREVLLPLGISLEWERYHQHYIGISDRKMAEDLVKRAKRPVTVEEISARYDAKTELFREEIRRQLPFAPGVVEFVRSLNGYRVGVVSSSRSSEVRPVLEAGGLWESLSVTVFGEDVTRHKPDPEPYRKAAAILGVRRALVVEDSEAGVASGRAAGFDVLRIPDPARTVELVRRRLGMDG